MAGAETAETATSSMDDETLDDESYHSSLQCCVCLYYPVIFQVFGTNTSKPKDSIVSILPFAGCAVGWGTSILASLDFAVIIMQMAYLHTVTELEKGSPSCRIFAYGVLPQYKDMNFSMPFLVSKKEKRHEVTVEGALHGPLIQTVASGRGLLKLLYSFKGYKKTGIYSTSQLFLHVGISLAFGVYIKRCMVYEHPTALYVGSRIFIFLVFAKYSIIYY